LNPLNNILGSSRVVEKNIIGKWDVTDVASQILCEENSHQQCW
jgi:hypothetical protein